MKKFIFRIVIFFIFIAAIDSLLGRGLDYMVAHTAIGGRGKDEYVSNVLTDDVLVFGSSRAESHYNAQMISDSLGLSCYNCGESGILLSYGRLLMLLERHAPKQIIYDIFPDFDCLSAHTDIKLWLSLHYDRQGIDTIFIDMDATEKYKMRSRLYRHNPSFLKNLAAYFSYVKYPDIKGFTPRPDPFDSMKSRDIQKYYDRNRVKYEYSPLNIKYLYKFLDKAQSVGTQVTFTVSPIWYGMDTLVLGPVKKICQERDIPLLDFSNDSKYVHNDAYFCDGTHLNAHGANEFSKDLIKKLQQLN